MLIYIQNLHFINLSGYLAASVQIKPVVTSCIHYLYLDVQTTDIAAAYASFIPGYMSPGNVHPGRATCIRIHICRRTHVRIQVARPGYLWLYLGDIITIHLWHGRLVSFCIQQQTVDKLATILSPIQDTCRRRQVDTTCIMQHRIHYLTLHQFDVHNVMKNKNGIIYYLHLVIFSLASAGGLLVRVYDRRFMSMEFMRVTLSLYEFDIVYNPGVTQLPLSKTRLKLSQC